MAVLVSFLENSSYPPPPVSLSSFIFSKAHVKCSPNLSLVCKILFKVSGQTIKLERIGNARLVRHEKSKKVGVEADAIFGKEKWVMQAKQWWDTTPPPQISIAFRRDSESSALKSFASLHSGFFLTVKATARFQTAQLSWETLDFPNLSPGNSSIEKKLCAGPRPPFWIPVSNSELRTHTRLAELPEIHLSYISVHVYQ